MNALAHPHETLATAIDRKYPRRRGYGGRYQNGIKPGPAKLAQFQEVLALRGTPPLYGNEGKGWDAIAQVKLFDPSGSWTWYITEWDGHTEAFGVAEGHEWEFGHVDLAALAEVRGRFGIGIEIDMHWTPRPLRECFAFVPQPEAAGEGTAVLSVRDAADPLAGGAAPEPESLTSQTTQRMHT